MNSFVNDTGYLNDSPHRFNPFNIIKSKTITMNNILDSITTKELLNLNNICSKNAHNLKCIYKITSPSEKIYIGKTNNFYERMKNYCSSYNRRKKDQVRLNNSLYKYGFRNHKIEIIEILENSEDLIEREKYYILLFDTYNTFHGMNLTSGGEGCTGRKMTEYNKIKLIKANTGIIRTDKQKETMSKAHKGKISNRKGVILSEETKRKISLSQIKRKHQNKLNLISV